MLDRNYLFCHFRTPKETATADLELILQDQKDLYSEEEIGIIERELTSRK